MAAGTGFSPGPRGREGLTAPSRGPRNHGQERRGLPKNFSCAAAELVTERMVVPETKMEKAGRKRSR